jgi:hypothetical protein
MGQPCCGTGTAANRTCNMGLVCGNVPTLGIICVSAT